MTQFTTRVLVRAVTVVMLLAAGTAVATFAPNPVVAAAHGASPKSHQAPCGRSSSPPVTYSHVLWILMENKRYPQVIGDTNDAPYINRIASECASLTQYEDAGSGYPSLPNYLALTSGGVQGISTDQPPAVNVPVTADNIFRQVRALGGTAKSYEEGMPTNCDRVNEGTYLVRHNPAAYYSGADDAAACAQDDVPLGTPSGGALADDLHNGLPTFGFITPDRFNDMHDGASLQERISAGDAWLAQWLPQILTSPDYTAGTTAVFVLWDEDTPMPNLFIAPTVPTGLALTDSGYGHYSVLRTTEEMLGIHSLLGAAASTPSLRGPLNL